MTLYERRGRRYVPVRDTDAYEGLPDGVWLVEVDLGGGRQTMRRLLSPDYAEGAARLLRARARLIEELQRCSAWQPTGTRPLTRKEQRALAAYRAVLGDDATLVLSRPCAADVIDRALAAWEAANG